MKRTFHTLTLAFGLALLASGVQAACIVEYKAKRDNPLELYFETVEIDGNCSMADATARLQEQLAKNGQTLLKVMSVRKK